MHNVCNVRMPHAMGDVIADICIGIAAADSIGYRAPARYRSNAVYDQWVNTIWLYHVTGWVPMVVWPSLLLAGQPASLYRTASVTRRSAVTVLDACWRRSCSPCMPHIQCSRDNYCDVALYKCIIDIDIYSISIASWAKNWICWIITEFISWRFSRRKQTFVAVLDGISSRWRFQRINYVFLINCCQLTVLFCQKTIQYIHTVVLFGTQNRPTLAGCRRRRLNQGLVVALDCLSVLDRHMFFFVLFFLFLDACFV